MKSNINQLSSVRTKEGPQLEEPLHFHLFILLLLKEIITNHENNDGIFKQAHGSLQLDQTGQMIALVYQAGYL